MSDLVTLDQLLVPDLLSGRHGRNRGRGLAQIAAQDDRSAVLAWLARYADSPATLASYRKEAERLLLWCVRQHQVPLSDLSHEDLLVYQHFLGWPEPAERWVTASGQKPGRASPAWRPFAGPLSLASQRQALSILNGMFNWLVEAGYLAGNPLALSRRKARTRAPRVSRFLPQEHWQEVKNSIEAMPVGTAREALHAARCRWLFSLLYVGGLRVTEVCTATMGSLFMRRSGDGRERWWLEITGKGDKTRLVPATEELVFELVRYREAHGLPSLPTEGDSTPLLLPVIGSAKPMARTAVHEIVKGVMRNTASRLRKLGPDFDATATHIERASTHWLRHTAGTHLSDHVDIKLVRDNLGHSSIATTSVYLHSEDDQRHDETSSVHRVLWRQT
ncbi:MAG: tyrosine-type recombinase/integrase [Burkholderiaceae bacterium]|nr:tyrosine-type recombinase/integrase [Burkholderiaceae bacterium]